MFYAKSFLKRREQKKEAHAITVVRRQLGLDTDDTSASGVRGLFPRSSRSLFSRRGPTGVEGGSFTHANPLTPMLRGGAPRSTKQVWLPPLVIEDKLTYAATMTAAVRTAAEEHDAAVRAANPPKWSAPLLRIPRGPLDPPTRREAAATISRVYKGYKVRALLAGWSKRVDVDGVPYYVHAPSGARAWALPSATFVEEVAAEATRAETLGEVPSGNLGEWEDSADAVPITNPWEMRVSGGHGVFTNRITNEVKLGLRVDGVPWSQARLDFSPEPVAAVRPPGYLGAPLEDPQPVNPADYPEPQEEGDVWLDARGMEWHTDGFGGRTLAKGWRRIRELEDVWYENTRAGLVSWTRPPYAE